MILLHMERQFTKTMTNGHTQTDHQNHSDEMDVDGSHDSSQTALHQMLLTTSTGALGLVTPLSETLYRQLSVVQTFLTNNLDHVCGLNPRAYRSVHDNEGLAIRGVLDGSLLCRWPELNTQRRAELWSRLGNEKDDVLEGIRISCGGSLRQPNVAYR